MRISDFTLFIGCTSLLLLLVTALPIPCVTTFSAKSDLITAVTNYLGKRDECLQTGTGIGTWDVSRIDDMSGLFREKGWTFKVGDDLNLWDTSKVTDMSNMFAGSTDMLSLLLTTGMSAKL